MHSTSVLGVSAIDAAEAVAYAAGVTDAAIVIQVACYTAIVAGQICCRTTSYVSYVLRGRLVSPPDAFMGPFNLDDAVVADVDSYSGLAYTMTSFPWEPSRNVPLRELAERHPALLNGSEQRQRFATTGDSAPLHSHMPYWAANAPILVVHAGGQLGDGPCHGYDVPNCRELLESLKLAETADTPPIAMMPLDYVNAHSVPVCPPVYLELLAEHQDIEGGEADRSAGPRRVVLFDWLMVERGALIAAVSQPDFRSAIHFDDKVATAGEGGAMQN